MAKHILFAAVVFCVATAMAQSAPSKDPFLPLTFLEGTWEAKATGTAGGDATGTYSFRRELNGHVLARHSLAKQDCQASREFCDHRDLLYIYAETPNAPLKAIYFDVEGHTIHYTVSAPTATSAVFLSAPAANGMRFRLSYELNGSTMTGRFELLAPGQQNWHSYLVWSGKKVTQ